MLIYTDFTSGRDHIASALPILGASHTTHSLRTDRPTERTAKSGDVAYDKHRLELLLAHDSPGTTTRRLRLRQPNGCSTEAVCHDNAHKGICRRHQSSRRHAAANPILCASKRVTWISTPQPRKGRFLCTALR